MRIDVGRAAAGAVPWPDAVARPRPVDGAPSATADKAAATPYGDLESSLRAAALRRDAPPAPSAGAPAVQTTAEQLAAQRAAPTPTSLAVTTALAAYAAAAATAPPRPPSSAGAASTSARDEQEADGPESPEEPARDGGGPPGARSGGYSARA